MTWEYIKGSEEDFEGAPEWANHVITGGEFAEKWFLESFSEIADAHCRIDMPHAVYRSLDYKKDKYNIVAERRPQLVQIPGRARRNYMPELKTEEQIRQETGALQVASHDKYNRPCKGVTIDVYDVLHAFNVTNPALQHLVKKALAAGLRGHKDRQEDLQDILASAKRAIELES